MDAVALRARDLRTCFGPPGNFTLRVAELALNAGGLYGFVGPNGAGKTVLFEALSLVAPPDEGEIELHGEPIFPRGADGRRLRRQMALVMEKPYLFRGTVESNVAYGLRARGLRTRERNERVSAALLRMGLAHLARRDVRHLSGGEVQRVAIARALVLEPRVLLLDEPTAHVDAEHAGAIEAFLQELHHDGRVTVLLSTHDLEQAYRLSDQIFLLVEGGLQRHAPENCFLGTVTLEDGRSWFEGRTGLRIQVLTQESGPARIFIDPRSILLSQEPLRSSGRNTLTGTVRAVAGQARTLRVRVAAGGVEFTAYVTRESAAELGLMPGEQVHMTFKVTGACVYML